MKDENIRNPIAWRTLSMGGDSVIVAIGQPELLQPDDEFACQYSISWRGKNISHRVIGVDSVQAVQIVMMRIGTELVSLAKENNLQITWLADTPGEIGFPIG
jgi:hypothetical protein